MKTFNRIYSLFDRLKLKKKSYIRRSSFIVMISLLLVSFQNCSQGQFEIKDGESTAASQSSAVVDESNNSNGSAANGSIPTPPPTVIAPPPPAGGPILPTQAEINAEIARRNRCKSAIKAPVFTNISTIANRVVSLNSGLAEGSGDSLEGAGFPVTVDASQGIDTSKFSVADGCTLRTRVEIDPVIGDSSKPVVYVEGIDSEGNAVLATSTDGQKPENRMDAMVQTMPNNNNRNLTIGINSLNINFVIRQAQNNNARMIRCGEGSQFFRVRIKAESTGLNQQRANYPGSNVGDAVAYSSEAFVKVDVKNSCWKETNLTKVIASSQSSSIPSTNALLGSAVAVDGDWAAAVSSREGGTGFIYIFRKVAGNWTFFQKFKGQNGNGTALTGVALKNNLLVVSSSGDGLYVASPLRMGYPGRVFLYSLTGSLITDKIQVIDNPQGIGTKFGSSIAIAGNSIAIGDAYGSGRAYLYNLSSGLYGANGTSNRTYSAVLDGSSISSSVISFGNNIVYQGGRLIVAAYAGNEGYKGSVHLFDVGGGSFGSKTSIDAPTGFTNNGLFGYAIAFNGTALVVGAYENATVGTAAGAIAYYADYTSTAAPVIVQGNAAEERFGVSLAFTGDSLYVGSRGGTEAPGMIRRYKTTSLNASLRYGSTAFVQTSHSANNGEGFSYGMAILSGATVPTLFVSAQTKDFNVSDSLINSKAGSLFMYEVK